jgi:hypothetical protein
MSTSARQSVRAPEYERMGFYRALDGGSEGQFGGNHRKLEMALKLGVGAPC